VARKVLSKITVELPINSTDLKSLQNMISTKPCVRVVCPIRAGGIPMARKAGQIIARGQSTRLVRVDLGRDSQTGTRKYHNQIIDGPFREAQLLLNLKLQQGDNGQAGVGG
jgi:hypothetical protein